ncbi:hypothetical protein EYF80_046894 [Liparis tanakae]|uniref:Uncharacterized protein n=1 Tax=Liparis tanakae TaxID=230148 RepID=A0A4Z2FPE6_9TELE|nr:hypothetical protein EYF80_046894 [Liparis tanakae]
MFLKRASDRTFRASVSSFRTALVSRFPFSARVSRCGRAASAGSSSRKASSVSSLKPISMLTSVEAWRCRCAHRRSMSRAARGMPDRSNAPLDRGADSTAFRLETHGPTGRFITLTPGELDFLQRRPRLTSLEERPLQANLPTIPCLAASPPTRFQKQTPEVNPGQRTSSCSLHV